MHWKQPKLKAFVRPQIDFIIWHDDASTAKPNHLFNTISNSVNNYLKFKAQNDGKVMNIRGPVMYFKLYDSNGMIKINGEAINKTMAILVAHSENFKDRLNISESELTYKIRSCEIYEEFPFGSEVTSRTCDLRIKQSSDSVCRKAKSKQQCNNCANAVEVTSETFFKWVYIQNVRKMMV